MKPVVFIGQSLQALRRLPAGARQDVGYAIELVQRGRSPPDFKPMPAVGPGAQELRVWDEYGTYRVIYVASLPDAVYVLRAFQKKTAVTRHADIRLARDRYRELKSETP
jgi:phage-related protein